MAMALAALLTACGGGGDDSPSTPASTVFPVAPVIASVLSVGASFSASTIEDGIKWTATQTFTPGKDLTFNGVVRKATSSVLTVTRDGQEYFTDSDVTYYALNPLVFYGRILGNLNDNYVIDGSLPDTSTVNTSGPLLHYASKNMDTGATVSTTVVTWSLEEDAATKALLCINARITDTTIGESSESDCYRIDTKGATDGTARISVTTGPGKTVTMK
jgi:hypothetical protein